jgi:hypothetical protein
MKTVEPQQPGYLSHGEAPAAPVDRLTGRQALLGHRPQSLPGAPLGVPDESIAFTERGQHSDRQTLKPAFPVGPFFAQDRWAPTLSVAPLALPTADSSQLPYPH